MNQSPVENEPIKYKMKPITGAQMMNTRFIPEVHLSTVKLILIVSTTTSMVFGIGGALANAGLLEALQDTTHK